MKAWWISVPGLVLAAAVGLYACMLPASPRRIAHDTLPSVVSLFIEGAEGRLVLSGSGFFVAPTVVATSLHVLAPEGRGFIKHAGQETLYPIAGVVALDAAHDVALILVGGHSSPALRLGDPTRIVVGDGIFVVSNPRGYEGTFSQGIVSAIRREGEIDVMQISAPISHGSSGGPVLNAAGQVIGVASALVDGEQNINFALPASLVAQLLARVNPTALAESLPAALDRASAGFADPTPSTPPDLSYDP